MAKGDLQGMYIRVGGDTSEYSQAMKKLDDSINDTTKNLNQVNKLLKLNPDSIEYAEEKQKLLAKAIEETEKKLNVLIDNERDINQLYEQGEIPIASYLEYKKQLENTQKELDGLIKQTEKTEESTKELGNEADKTSDDVKNLGDKSADLKDIFKGSLAADLAVEGLKAIGNAAKDCAKECAQVGIDFTSSMSNVAATMGMTAEDVNSGSANYEALKNAARECGETTKYSATESADALNYLALAGYDVDKSVETLPKVLNLATASGMDLASCTDMVTDTMSALQIETGDLDGYMDMMAKTAQKSNTTVAMLGEGILQCAGTVSSTGQDIDTMCTSLGVLANNGMKGAEGGTHLRNMLLSLTAPTDTAKQKLNELGVSVSDNTGNVRDINDVFTDLNSKLSGLSESKKTEALNQIFNKTDLSAVNAMLESTNGSFDALKENVDNADGACKDMADTMNNNLKGKLTILDSSLEGLGITIFDKFDKPLQSAAEKGTEVISELTESVKDGELSEGFEDMGESFEDLAETTGNFAKITLPVIIKAITFFCEHSNMIIGGLTGIASAMITQKAVNIVGDVVTKVRAFAKATEGASAAQKALNAVQAVSPWGLLATGVGIAVAGIVSYATATDDAAESTSNLSEKEQALVDETEEMNKSFEDMAKKREEAFADIDAEYGGYETMADKIFELSDAENKSNEQKAEMKSLVDELNEAMPDLNLQIDEQTGKLINSKDAVYDCIEAKKEQLLVEAAQKDMVEIAEELYKAQKKQSELEDQITKKKTESLLIHKKITQLNADLANADRSVYRDLCDQYDNLNSQQEELQKSYDETGKNIKSLNKEYDNIGKSVSENTDVLYKNTEAVEGNSTAVDNIYNKTVMYKDGLHKVSQETIDQINALNSEYDEAVAKRTEELQNNLNLFEEFNGGAEISADELMTNLESNLNGIAEWSENLKELADRGVNKGLIKTLQDAGPSSASKIQAMLQMDDIELQKYSDMWEEVYGACGDIAREEYQGIRDENDKTIKNLLDTDFQSLRDYYFNSGADLVRGLKDGIISEQEAVVISAKNCAEAVLSTVRDVYDIRSPSKKFKQIAIYNAEGEIQGRKEKEKDLIKAYTETSNKILSASMSENFDETNRLARSVYNGSYARSIVKKGTPSETTTGKESTAGFKFPETVKIIQMTPNGKVLAEESFPFIDIMLGSAAEKHSRGGAV